MRNIRIYVYNAPNFQINNFFSININKYIKKLKKLELVHCKIQHTYSIKYLFI